MIKNIELNAVPTIAINLDHIIFVTDPVKAYYFSKLLPFMSNKYIFRSEFGERLCKEYVHRGFNVEIYLVRPEYSTKLDKSYSKLVDTISKIVKNEYEFKIFNSFEELKNYEYDKIITSDPMDVLLSDNVEYVIPSYRSISINEDIQRFNKEKMELFLKNGWIK